ncbi:hypothetical protein ACFLX9_02595 [Chloroflexota bacterium]
MWRLVMVVVLAGSLGAACTQPSEPTPDLEATVAAMVATQVAGQPTPTPTPTAEPTWTPAPTWTPVPTWMPTPLPPTATPTLTPTPTSAPEPTSTPTPTNTPTLAPIPTHTPTPTPVPTVTPTFAPQSRPTPTPWAIPTGAGTNYRAVHMGGNWGITRDAVHELPPEYFEYLRDLNVDWVGISVALHLEDSMDSTVERKYGQDMFIPTFTDETLVAIIRAFRKHGFNVYLALAFESGAGAKRPVQRWQLGDPTAHEYDSNVLPEYWPWRLDHPDHQRFVAEFWETYTEQAVHFAEIAEAEGVGLYCIGTETDRLFRSRSGGVWPNHFENEMTAMVSAVRSAFSGLLGYEMHWQAVVDRGYFGPGSDHLFEDLGLDVVGVSAYFQLAESPSMQVLSVQDLEPTWEAVFQERLIPLQNRNPGKPIVFTEFGYVDSVMSPYMASMDEFSDKIFKDKDGNGLDDGEEVQSNVYESFFDAMDRHPGVVQGAFLWDTMMGTQQQWQQAFGSLRNFSIRDKLVEDIVRTWYQRWS